MIPKEVCALSAVFFELAGGSILSSPPKGVRVLHLLKGVADGGI